MTFLLGYALGLLTPVALIVVTVMVYGTFRPPTWTQIECVRQGCPRPKWSRDEHPHRPAWVWGVLVYAHDLRWHGGR